MHLTNLFELGDFNDILNLLISYCEKSQDLNFKLVEEIFVYRIIYVNKPPF